MNKINLQQKFDLINEHWSPKIVAELNGQHVKLANGTLGFTEIRTWMGYTVFYDPSVLWMLAAVGVGVAGLAWHIFDKFRKSPWDLDIPTKSSAHA